MIVTGKYQFKSIDYFSKGGSRLITRTQTSHKEFEDQSVNP